MNTLIIAATALILYLGYRAFYFLLTRTFKNFGGKDESN